MVRCNCCEDKEATIKDYRYIDSIGAQGKIFVCADCFRLNDMSFAKEYRRGFNRLRERGEIQ